MAFTAFFGLFQYFVGSLESFKATSAIEFQIFAKVVFLEFWNKSAHKLPVWTRPPKKLPKQKILLNKIVRYTSSVTTKSSVKLHIHDLKTIL